MGKSKNWRYAAQSEQLKKQEGEWKGGGKRGKRVRSALHNQSPLATEDFTEKSFARMEAAARRNLERSKRQINGE